MIFSFGSFYSCSFVLINWFLGDFKVFFQTALRPRGPLLSVLSESRQRYFKNSLSKVYPERVKSLRLDCRLRFVAAGGEKGALRLPPPPKSRHPAL